MKRKNYILLVLLSFVAMVTWANDRDVSAFIAPFAANHLSSPDSLNAFSLAARLGLTFDSTTSNLRFLCMAHDWLGVPYRRAGTTKAGIDCSGFVSRVYYELFDIKLTHSSAGMLSQMKERVKKGQLAMLDVLFFKIHGRHISHVGIYLGNNLFIHASPQRGIVIDNLLEPYYKRTYFTAGRIN